MSTNNKLPTREQSDSRFHWDLASVYANDQLWEQDYQRVVAFLKQMSDFEGQLGIDADNLLAGLKLLEQLACIAERVTVYASMKRDEDTANSHYQGLADRTQSLASRVGAATAFVEPEILALPESRVDEFYASQPELEHYRHYLERVLRRKPHTLSPGEERLLSMAAELAAGPYTVFSMLTNADIRFPEIKGEDGELIELTPGRYIMFMTSPNRRVRKEAFDALYETYAKYKNTLAASLGVRVKADLFYARARKFPTALEAALFDDNVPVSVYDNLIQTVNDNLAPLHRYISLKKRVLSLDDTHMYDLYAPLVGDAKVKIDYHQARETILTALAPLGTEYINTAAQGLDSGWVDVYENRGKRSGAYSWGSYDTKPFILLNYDSTLNSMSTFAHELGHSMHSWFSNANQAYTYAQYPIFTAEVASTVNEALLNKYLMDTSDDPRRRLYVINEYLETIRGTVYRQVMFAQFEKLIHARQEEGHALTHEDFTRMWLELNRDYYGPDAQLDAGIGMEWARIPHFYYNFYVYKYATGFAAATSLAAGILAEEPGARERYINFLKSGGSDYPLNLLAKAGVDMSLSRPIVQTLKVFADLVAELERCLQA